MDKIELTIVAITSSDTQEHGFVVVLKEVGGQRHLPILVGGFEARAIAMEIERIYSPRPMTHDLMKQVIIEMGGDLFEVLITELKDDVYFANLVVLMDNGTKIKIDARTSDAIALAVRFGCGIYVEPSVLEKAGIEWGTFVQVNEGEETVVRTPENPFATLTTEELNQELDKALADEAYEKAAAIRDELKKRKDV